MKHRYSICVSGAASGSTVAQSFDEAYELGRLIAHKGHITTTGATIGLPYYAAQGAMEAKGMSIGFSPASSMREHLRKYRLPADVFDYVIYTGMHYVGRDVFLVQSSDAVITVGGRFGSLHEFSTALISGMVCGVLTGSGGTADQIEYLLSTLEAVNRDMVIFDSDPERLVDKVIAKLDEDFKDITDTDLSSKWFAKKSTHLG